MEKERLINVSWGDVEQVYPVTVKIDAWDRVGLVRDISAIISEEGVNITAANVSDHDDNVTSLYFTLEIKSAAHLSKLLSRIHLLWNVINVAREGEPDAK